MELGGVLMLNGIPNDEATAMMIAVLGDASTVKASGSSNGSGFGIGLMIGLGAGIAIGSMLALRRRQS